MQDIVFVKLWFQHIKFNFKSMKLDKHLVLYNRIGLMELT